MFPPFGECRQKPDAVGLFYMAVACRGGAWSAEAEIFVKK